MIQIQKASVQYTTQLKGKFEGFKRSEVACAVTYRCNKMSSTINLDSSTVFEVCWGKA